MKYLIKKVTSKTELFVVEANSEQWAKEMIIFADVEPVDVDIVDKEIIIITLNNG